MSRNPIYIKMINSKRWKDLRLRKLSDTPLCEACEACEANGKSTLAGEVHHRIPVESVPTETRMRELMFNYGNLMSVCPACHADIHKEMFSHTKESVKANKRRQTQRFIDRFF